MGKFNPGLPSPEGNPIIKAVYRAGIEQIPILPADQTLFDGNERFIPVAPWDRIRLRINISQGGILTCFFADSQRNEIGGRVAATGTLTLALVIADTETVVIGGKTYIFQTVLTNVDGNVLIDGLSNSLDNLIAAINLDPAVGNVAAPGTLYAAATTRNVDVSAAAGAGTTMDVTARYGGVSGNAITTTETLAGAGNQWGGATLGGGVNNTDISVDDTTIVADTELVANITGGEAAAPEHTGEPWLVVRVGALAALADVAVFEASGSSF